VHDLVAGCRKDAGTTVHPDASTTGAGGSGTAPPPTATATSPTPTATSTNQPPAPHLIMDAGVPTGKNAFSPDNGKSGCDCRVSTGHASHDGAAWAALAAALVAVRRRRARRAAVAR
jgi:MYXO-CTERM domain-containing protein